MPEFLAFPPNFLWGASTSAFQIEGACNEDGRGPSIWDTFCAQPGKIRTGETGETATDHYHRVAEDLALMEKIGLNAYRFSIAWPRVMPQGTGSVNPAGLDFYDRLVDKLLARGITPFPTLFHYDLPQPLHELGGWPNRDTAKHFGDYTAVVAKRLGDRVKHWITQNEPWVTAGMGYLTGEHAPGIRSPFAALAAVHHILLSHGYAVQALRAASPAPVQVGIALSLSPSYGASKSRWDTRAAAMTDAFINRITLDPLLKGEYPDLFVRSPLWRLLERGLRRSPRRLFIEDDLQIISAPMDFLGINYYTRSVVRYMPILQALQIRPPGAEYSDMWEIYPTGLSDLLQRLHADYSHANLVITENGVPVPDKVEPDGRIHDTRRIAFLRDHIAAVQRAIQAGVPVTGYFVWSLMDNFEWAFGYAKRFGLVHVDFQTQERRLKDSAFWYADVIRRNGVEIG